MWHLLLSVALGLLWCASCMAVGDEDSPLVTELKGLFGSTCNGVKLSTALALALVSYFIAVVKITDVEEVPKDAVDEMEEAATEAWQTAHSMDLPKSLALRVRKWAGLQASSPVKETLAGSSGIGDVAEQDRQNAAKTIVDTLDLNAFDKEKAVKDMANQGLQLSRIKALSYSLTLGYPVSLSKVIDMPYGEDPALSDMAKKARKANKRLLQDVIKTKDCVRTAVFFSDLARKFALDGMTVESSLISTWWTETASCFASDADSLHTYLEDYFEKYAGRGLPVPVDALLMIRMRHNATGGASKEEMRTLKAGIAEMKEANTKLKSRMQQAEDRLTALKNKTPGGPAPPAGPKKTAAEIEEIRKNTKCRLCGEMGHFKNECPQLKDKEDEH